MKKIAVSLLLAASLGLAACESEPERLPGGDPVETDEANECPRQDGAPCR